MTASNDRSAVRALHFPRGSAFNSRIELVHACSLQAIDEAPLLELSRTSPESHIYRLMSSRDERRSVCVRLEVAPTGSGTLTAKVRHRRDPLNTTARVVPPPEVARFLCLLEDCRYWDMATHNVPGFDGWYYLLEATRNGVYKFVNRWVPDDAIRCAGEMLLRFAGLADDTPVIIRGFLGSG